MPKQTNSQRIGAVGQSIVETVVRKSGKWIARNLTEDYGIDLELELVLENVTGKFIKAQIKTHQKVASDKPYVVERMKKSFLRYAYECRVPIILIVVSVETDELWYVWLQEWILASNNLSTIYDEKGSELIPVRILKSPDFSIALNSDLITVANWENETQIILALRDLANLSLKRYDQRLTTLLFEYLNEFYSQEGKNSLYIDILIDKVLSLGELVYNSIEGYNIFQQLRKFVIENGPAITADHVSKLIIRGDRYSRTGINILGVLFDHYPKHAASLELAKKFKKHGDPRPYYYCTIRERFIGQKSPEWLTAPDLAVGHIEPDFSFISTSILDKWANRGDSAILDFLIIKQCNNSIYG